ncbi:MAG: hypothetical protein FJW39_23325 [Acidobacteria bacterium]|nr:hypothetical protein [Acidobacteriota bacterium]
MRSSAQPSIPPSCRASPPPSGPPGPPGPPRCPPCGGRPPPGGCASATLDNPTVEITARAVTRIQLKFMFFIGRFVLLIRD